MKTSKEIINWLLKNAVDINGDLVIEDVDLSNFEGDVLIRRWTIKKNCSFSYNKVGGNLCQHHQVVGKNLYQDSCIVKDDLFQDNQTVGNELCQYNCTVYGDLFQNTQSVKGKLRQDEQNVEGNLYQGKQNVKGELISHKLYEDEAWLSCNDGKEVKRVKKLKVITREELKQFGYVLKD